MKVVYFSFFVRIYPAFPTPFFEDVFFPLYILVSFVVDLYGVTDLTSLNSYACIKYLTLPYMDSIYHIHRRHILLASFPKTQ